MTTTNPIKLEWDLNCTPPQAFDAFVNDIHLWWPAHTEPYSLGQKKVVGVTFEANLDGRIYETQNDGKEVNWGRVIACVTGKTLEFLWHPGREESAATKVKIEFHSEGGATKMTLEHSGWKGETAEASRENYLKGWQFVIGECFRANLLPKRN